MKKPKQISNIISSNRLTDANSNGVNDCKEIIIAFGLYGIGGAQRRAFNLANEFSKKGYTVYVMSVFGRDATIKDEDYYNFNKDVKHIIAPEYYQEYKHHKTIVCSDKFIDRKIHILKKCQILLKPFKKALHKLNYKIKYYRQCKEPRAFLLQHQKSTIIVFGFNVFDTVNFAAKGLNCKIVYAETNASDKYSWDRFYTLTSDSIKKSDALVFQTIVEKAEHGLTESEKSFVIHNPINSNLPHPYNGNRNKTIINFCRLSRQKNLLLLIQAFEKLLCDFPDFKLELYADTSNSDNSEYKNELLSYISKHNLSDSVFLFPPSADIHKIILDCAMFVSSSDYEGISNSMIEAMAIGLPCVCTNCGGGGAREMITDGENGLLVPVKDVEALKNAMVRMISEEGLAEKCSKNAAKIRDTHSIEKISEKWLNIIDNI